MGISVITPTIGRPSLKDVLDILIPQLHAEDEIIVVADGPNAAREMVGTGFAARTRYFEFGPTYNWGYSQRTFGLREARPGNWLVWCDDDNRPAPDALDMVRSAAATHPDGPLAFLMETAHNGTVYGREHLCQMGLIGGPMFVCPKVEGKVGYFDGKKYEGDWVFIRTTLECYGTDAQPYWTDRIICHANAYPK